MVELGTIKYGRDIGKKSESMKFLWVGCVDCGNERWVEISGNKPRTLRCLSCGNKGKFNPQWKGGQRFKEGYMQTKLYPNDFFYSMAQKNGYALEHRLVMAKHLGRNLHRWEVVHHKNGIKNDNRIENLQLVSDDRHAQITILETRIGHLEKRIILLEAENALLRGATR